MRNVLDVPSETMASSGRRGKDRIVAGLSPVNGVIWQSGLKPYRFTKYDEIPPRLPPPSIGTSPSFFRNSGTPSLVAVSSRSDSFHFSPAISHRFIPVTSLISIGAMAPRNREAKNDEASEMRAVLP